jgi:hypothetical protein
MTKPWVALVFLWFSAGGLARADDTLPNPDAELRLIETTERDEDPLGLDESTGKGLDEAANKLEQKRREPVLPSASRGEILTSIERVVESAHEVDISLEQGLAFVRANVRISSSSPYHADVAYRLALPERAVVTGVRLCRAKVCHEAQAYFALLSSPEPRAGSPFVRAQVIRDARGPALSLLLSSATREQPLELTVSYVAEAPVHAGRARFVLPARGRDPHAAASHVRVSSKYAATLEPAEAVDVDAFFDLPISATLRDKAPVQRAVTQAPCGRSRCTRQFAVLPSRAPSEAPVWLLLDASPSMEGPARARLDMALAALLAALPEHTEVRAFAFAARARELGSYRAATAPLSTLSEGATQDLGPGTRPSSLLALLPHDAAASHARLVLLSDARFDPSPREHQALATLARRGSELWLVALGGAPSPHDGVFTSSGGGVLTVSALADAALRSGNLEALSEALAVIASTRVQGLRAGEETVREMRPAKLDSLPTHWLAHWLRRDLPQPSWITGDSQRDEAAIAAPTFQDAPAPAPSADTGMPAQSVLNMLRTQLLPKARACLRSDRKGRGDYAVQVTFHALFAQREISDVRIEGKIQEALRSCLEGVLSELRVPAFSGRIRVRYPIHTEREPDPPVIQLEPDVAAQVERVIHAPEPPRATPERPARAPVVE